MAIGRPRIKPKWHGVASVEPISYVCGFCGDKVGPDKGWLASNNPANTTPMVIRVCSSCGGPTFFDSDGSCYPGTFVGGEVGYLPPDVAGLYKEARLSAAGGAPTAAVMACRKMLMNIAVEKGAPEGATFASYVEFLAEGGYVPPDGKEIIDHIKDRGNEANHQIALMQDEDAKALITFVEMLLKFIHEFPKAVTSDSEEENTGGKDSTIVSRTKLKARI